jgi:hypothetical protein
MNVSRVKEFISSLAVHRTTGALAEYDEAFLTSFDVQFSSLAPTESLTPSQLQWIQEQFAARWKKVRDTANDYTQNSADTNKLWISLARDLAVETDKTFLQILMSLAHDIDPSSMVRHSDDASLDECYLGDDNVTLYNIRELLSHLSRGFLYTYRVDMHDEKKPLLPPYPLSLQELLRIRSKKGTVTLDGKEYTSYWNYLTQKRITGTTVSGEAPRHFLSTKAPSVGLLEIVELYFKEKSRPENLIKALLLWSKLLQDGLVEDVNYLYQQKIKVGDKDIFLIDILLDCLENATAATTADTKIMDDKMIGVARWLCQYDASLVVKDCEELHALYRQQHVGKDFNYIYLINSLFTILENSLSTEIADQVKLMRREDSINPSKLRLLLSRIAPEAEKEELAIEKRIIALIGMLLDKKEIFKDLGSEIVGIYHLRWAKIKGTDLDYTRLQTGVNAPWIKLAQQLAGQYFTLDYYRVLMQLSLGAGELGMMAVTDNPLSRYIEADAPSGPDTLGRTPTSLISLEDCVRLYKASGVFYNCNTDPPSALSETEIARIAFAHKRYHKYIAIAKGGIKDAPPISYETVMAIYQLAIESLYIEGLTFSGSYDRAQYDAAALAYSKFKLFLDALPSEEKVRLLGQCIEYKGKVVKFSGVLDGVLKGKSCVALSGRYLVKLVLDYYPTMKFPEPIEARVIAPYATYNMRLHSAKKVLRDYESIDQAEAVKRLHILAASLMSYSFLSSVDVAMLGCSHNIASAANEIFKQLNPMIQSQDFTHARFVYVSIIESIVKPALRTIGSDKNKFFLLSWDARTNLAAKDWFESIANGSLFSTYAWFPPQLLLTKLYPIAPALEASTAKEALLRFLDELIGIYADKRLTASQKALKINIKFARFYNSLDSEALQSVVQKQLNKAATGAGSDPNEFNKKYASFLSNRLMYCARTTPSFFSGGFFGGKASPNARTRAAIHMALSMPAEFSSVEALIKIYLTRVHSIVDKVDGVTIPEVRESKNRMLKYLGTLDPTISLLSPSPSPGTPPSIVPVLAL